MGRGRQREAGTEKGRDSPEESGFRDQWDDEKLLKLDGGNGCTTL